MLQDNQTSSSPTASEIKSENLSSSDSSKDDDEIDNVGELESSLINGLKGRISKVFNFVKGDADFHGLEDYAESQKSGK